MENQLRNISKTSYKVIMHMQRQSHKRSPIHISLKDYPEINLTKEGTDSYNKNLKFLRKRLRKILEREGPP